MTGKPSQVASFPWAILSVPIVMGFFSLRNAETRAAIDNALPLAAVGVCLGLVLLAASTCAVGFGYLVCTRFAWLASYPVADRLLRTGLGFAGLLLCACGALGVVVIGADAYTHGATGNMALSAAVVAVCLPVAALIPVLFALWLRWVFGAKAPSQP